MKPKRTKIVTEEVSVYFDEGEIIEMIKKQSGITGDTIEVIFYEATYGGINGCWVKAKTTHEEEN